MNRKQRRWLMRKVPGYRNLLNEAAAKSYEEFKDMMKKQWEDSSENATDTKKDGQNVEDRDDKISE